MGRKLGSRDYAWGLHHRGSHLKIKYTHYVVDNVFYVKATVDGYDEVFKGRSIRSDTNAKLRCIKKLYVYHCSQSQGDYSSDDENGEFDGVADTAQKKYLGNYILAVEQVKERLGLTIASETVFKEGRYYASAIINGGPDIITEVDESELRAEMKLAKQVWVRYCKDEWPDEENGS
jgi:hypothetical protein